MRVELIANQADDLGFGITFVNQPAQLSGAIKHSSARRHFDMPPASLWLAKQKEVGRAVPLVLKIRACEATRRGWQRSASLGDQLFALFIKTDFRALGIIRLVVEIEHIFHPRDEFRTDFRETPLFLLPRLESVFFRYCRTVSCESEAESPNSTALSANKRSVQRRRPVGAWLQATATRCASALGSSLSLCPGRGCSWRHCKLSSTKRRRTRSMVGTLVETSSAICSSLNPSSALSRMRARVALRVAVFPLRSKRCKASRSSALNSMMYFFITSDSCSITGVRLYPMAAQPSIST